MYSRFPRVKRTLSRSPILSASAQALAVQLGGRADVPCVRARNSEVVVDRADERGVDPERDLERALEVGEACHLVEAVLRATDRGQRMDAQLVVVEPIRDGECLGSHRLGLLEVARQHAQPRGEGKHARLGQRWAGIFDELLSPLHVCFGVVSVSAIPRRPREIDLGLGGALAVTCI